MTSTVQFTAGQIEEVAGTGLAGLRGLVASVLAPEWHDCSKVFDALVDEVTAVLNRVVTETDANLPAPSATQPGAQQTWFRARPKWSTGLSIQYQAPQGGSVTGVPCWRQD
jgi:hypothetical protein